jgi:hypothetical protein
MRTINSIFIIFFIILCFPTFGKDEPRVKKKIQHSSLTPGLLVYYYDRNGNETLYVNHKNTDTIEIIASEFDSFGNEISRTIRPGLNKPILEQTLTTFKAPGIKNYSFATWRGGARLLPSYYDTSFYFYNSYGYLDSASYGEKHIYKFNADSTVKSQINVFRGFTENNCESEYGKNKQLLKLNCFDNEKLVYVTTFIYSKTVVTSECQNMQSGETTRRIDTYDKNSNLLSIEEYDKNGKLSWKVWYDYEYY